MHCVSIRTNVLGWWLASILLTASASLAQVPPRERAASSGEASATIRGRVFGADTGRPLRRARITIAGPELVGASRTTTTGVDGRYEVRELPAGKYSVSVSRSGYLTLRYGQRRVLETEKQIAVVDKQVMDGVDFSLPRMGLITGRVSDETGEPMEGVTVSALRSRFWNGRRQLVPTGQGFAQTDDTGEFRIRGLQPGSYYVVASTRETWSVDQNGIPLVLGYAPTYFPGTAHLAEARRISIGPSQAVSAIDFLLVPGRTAKVSGTAVDSRGTPFSSVSLRDEVRGEGFARFGSVGQASVTTDGHFTIASVPPGEYRLVATGVVDGHPEAALLPVTVDGVDLLDLRLQGSGGGKLSGHVLTDQGLVPNIPRVTVTLGALPIGQPDPNALFVSRSPGVSPVSSDGTFAIDGIFEPGRLGLNLPDGWMVRTITYEGRDVTDTPIDVAARGGDVTDVEVIITNKVSVVSGEVTNAKGTPESEATVVLFSTDPAQWGRDSRGVRVVRPTPDGGFEIKGMPPGDYVAVALDYLEDGSQNDPDVLEPLLRRGAKITITDSTTQRIALRVLRPDAP